MSDAVPKTCAIAISINEKIRQANEIGRIDFASKNSSYQKWQTKHNQWKNCRNDLNCVGDYSGYTGSINDLRNEKKTWNNCVSNINNIFRNNAFDDWCRSDVGQGWEHKGATWDGCSPGSFTGKGICMRTEQGIKNFFYTDFIKSAAEPQGDDGNTWAGTNGPPEYKDLNLFSISCCQDQNFSGNTADKIFYDNITQTCNVTPPATPPTAPPTAPPATPPAAPPTAPPTATPPENDYTIVIIIVVILMVSISSSSSGAALLMI